MPREVFLSRGRTRETFSRPTQVLRDLPTDERPASDARGLEWRSFASSETGRRLKCRVGGRPIFKLSTSDQARRPAEFKHINKRRKRNQLGFPE